MIKEIHEQPRAMHDTLMARMREGRIDLSEINITEQLIQSIRGIHIVACGSAYHAGILGKYVIENIARIPVNVDVASEFLDMAARLVQIKSSMLLPKHEEAEALRQELTGELIEYQLCQEAARRLAARNVGGDLFVREPVEIEPDLTYRRQHPKEELYDAYLAAAGRGRRRLPPPPQAFSGIVSRKIVSVSSKIIFVLRRLYKREPVAYDALFREARTKSELVATFLALLELVKAKRIRVDGEGKEQTVQMLERVKTPSEADAAAEAQ